MRWQPGDAIVRRDVWHGEVMVGWGGIVVQDAAELLALYMPEGGSLGFTERDHWGGPHPWSGRDRWSGHGVLQLQRPGDMHAVWVFWKGGERAFAGSICRSRSGGLRWASIRRTSSSTS